MAWTIDYSETALKALRKLDRPAARRIIDFMDERIATADNQRHSGKALTGPGFGAFWRYRVGEWRIICDIHDNALRVLVVEVGNRREVYRG